jgi:hypothetical protein
MSPDEECRPPSGEAVSGNYTSSTGQVDDTESIGVRDYLNCTLGGTAGWLAALIGYGGYFDADGTYAFTQRYPRFYQWPGDADRAVRELTQGAHLADVYVCPYVMRSAVMTVPADWCHISTARDSRSTRRCSVREPRGC